MKTQRLRAGVWFRFSCSPAGGQAIDPERFKGPTVWIRSSSMPVWTYDSLCMRPLRQGEGWVDFTIKTYCEHQSLRRQDIWSRPRFLSVSQSQLWLTLIRILSLTMIFVPEFAWHPRRCL